MRSCKVRALTPKHTATEKLEFKPRKPTEEQQRRGEEDSRKDLLEGELSWENTGLDGT